MKDQTVEQWRKAKQQQQRAKKFRRVAGVVITFLGILMVLIGMSIGEISTDPWPTWGIALQAGWIILGGLVAAFGYRSALDD